MAELRAAGVGGWRLGALEGIRVDWLLCRKFAERRDPKNSINACKIPETAKVVPIRTLADSLSFSSDLPAQSSTSPKHAI